MQLLGVKKRGNVEVNDWKGLGGPYRKVMSVLFGKFLKFVVGVQDRVPFRVRRLVVFGVRDVAVVTR